MMFYQVKKMPRYDTTDFRFNSRELDPCIAAELRLKRSAINRYWVVAFGLVSLLLVLFGLVLFFGLSYFNSTGQYEGPLAAAETISAEPPPSSTFIFSDSTLPPTSESTARSTTTASTTEFTTPRLPPSQRAWTRPPSTWVPPATTTRPTTRLTTSTTTPSTTTSTTTLTTTTRRPTTRPIIVYEPLITQRVAYPTSTTEPPTLSPIVIRSGSRKYQTCADYRAEGYSESGIYKLFLPQTGEFYARCAMSAGGESWIVMQRRTGDGTVFWNRTFADYETGFGDPAGDHWLGLSRVRALIDAGHRLCLRLEVDASRCPPDRPNPSLVGDLSFAGDYNFSIGPPADGYRLNVSLIATNFTNSDVFVTETGGTFASAENPMSCAFTKRFGGFWFVNERTANCAAIAPNGEFTCDRKTSDYGAFVHHRGYTIRGSYLTYLLKLKRTSMSFRSC